ncbi:hypothetical protein MCP1_110043 [Candidatus Terasakiella magnetica]|nr:hypothetical protein MCP1_110043 [Candidatus Terasakiella magnetica]
MVRRIMVAAVSWIEADSAGKYPALGARATGRAPCGRTNARNQEFLPLVSGDLLGLQGVQFFTDFIQTDDDGNDAQFFLDAGAFHHQVLALSWVGGLPPHIHAFFVQGKVVECFVQLQIQTLLFLGQGVDPALNIVSRHGIPATPQAWP